MSYSKTEYLSFLDKSDSIKILAILADIEASIIGDWWLTGSLSYRLRLPNNQFQQGVRDIDISLHPKLGQDPQMLVKEDIKKYFYVVEIDHMLTSGYYFRFVHKKSRIPVDCFTVSHQPELQHIILDKISVDTESPEETLYYNLRNILVRDYMGLTIRQKTLNNANKLWSLVDQSELLLLLDKYHEEYGDYLPDNLVFDNVKTLVEHVLSRQAVDREKSGYIYPSDCPTTINGISIESQKIHRKALGIPSKTAGTLKWYISRIKNLCR